MKRRAGLRMACIPAALALMLHSPSSNASEAIVLRIANATAEPLHCVAVLAHFVTRDLPRLAPLPGTGSGPPHLSYAVQWFLFAGIVLIGFPVLVWRTARTRGDSAP